MKKSYYLKSGLYYDTTTGRTYIPKSRCELCGTTHFLTVHHYLNQQKAIRDINAKKVRYPSTWTEEFVKEKQKLFTLCTQCHNDVDNLDEKKFFDKYLIQKSFFIYKE
ncbi:MAG: hypothetical protein IKU37_08800 [Candidatus Gastranaerophilales bacterium]|nr:hypothetical protein [Candidatus Gastranaerophilales bacterium]